MFYRFSLLLTLSVFLAAAPLRAEPLKVGIINMPRALNETEEGKKILEVLKKKLTKENDELIKKQEELKKRRDELNKQAFLLSESARSQKEEEFGRLSRELDRFREDKRAEFVRMQQRGTEKIHKGLQEVMNDYAKSENYDLLLEAGQQAAGVPGAILYFKQAMDVTDKVIELYNIKQAEAAKKK